MTNSAASRMSEQVQTLPPDTKRWQDILPTDTVYVRMGPHHAVACAMSAAVFDDETDPDSSAADFRRRILLLKEQVTLAKEHCLRARAADSASGDGTNGSKMPPSTPQMFIQTTPAAQSARNDTVAGQQLCSLSDDGRRASSGRDLLVRASSSFLIGQ